MPYTISHLRRMHETATVDYRHSIFNEDTEIEGWYHMYEDAHKLRGLPDDTVIAFWVWTADGQKQYNVMTVKEYFS